MYESSWLRASLSTVIVFMPLACGGLLGTPMEQKEGSYLRRLVDLSALSERADDPAMEQKIDASKAGFEVV
jgi:hypothetical protein